MQDVEHGGRRGPRPRRFEYWSPNGDGAPRPRKSVLDRQKRADEFSARLRQDQQAKRAADRAEAAAEVHLELQRLEEKAKQAARRHQAAHEVHFPLRDTFAATACTLRSSWAPALCTPTTL
jgi:non-ribosomal peptide synthetase component F